MYRIIGGDGREYGPVTPDQLRQWISQNRANGQTLVKHEDAADWTPLGQIAEFVADFAAHNAPPGLPPDLPPPLPSAAAGDARDAATYIETCLTRSYRVDVGDAVSRGYDIVAKQLWVALGAVVVVGGVSAAIAMIPLISTANLALQGVFEAGLFFLFLAMARSGRATLGDAFAGFRIQFMQLVLFSLTRGVAVFSLLCITLVPAGLALGVGAMLQSPESSPGPGIVLFVLLLPFLFIPVIYFVVGWTFAPFLVIDRELGFWDAMELSRKVVAKRWFKLFFLYLAFVPIHFAGLLSFGVGLIYTMALQRATFTALYEDVFRE